MRRPTSLPGTHSELRDWRRPIEALENRRLLSASIGSGSADAIVSPTPIVVPLKSPVTGLTVHAVDGVVFNGPVAVWANSKGIPTPASGLKAEATIQWGDGTSSAGNLVQDGNGIVQINGSHTWTKPGTFNTLINVVEVPIVKPGQPTPQFIVEIGQGAGKAIVAKHTAGAVTIHPLVGQPFTGTVAHLNFHVPTKAGIGVYSATIDWGDGKTSDGKFASPTPTGNSNVVGTHTYSAVGNYNVHVVVTFGPAPGSTAKFATRVVATIDSTAIVISKNISLDGTIVGKYSPAPTAADIGATYVFNGTGKAGALGAVQAHGTVTIPGFVTTGHATGTLTLTSISASPVASGSVTLKLTGPTEKGLGPFPSKLNYVITGGTGAFAGVTGAGTIGVTLDTQDLAFAFVIHSLVPVV